MDALLIAQAERGIEADQVAPFLTHRHAIKAELNLDLEHHVAPELEQKRQLVARRPWDVVFIQTSWRRSAEQTIAFFQELRSETNAKIIYLDSFDSTATPLFGILPYVSLYVKKQVSRNLEDYGRPLHGGFVFTDFLVRRGLYDLKAWQFGSSLPRDQQHKLFCAWALGAAPHLVRDLWLSRIPPIRRQRPIDVGCRVGVIDGWHGFHRQMAINAVAKLRGKYNVVAEGYSDTNGQRLSRRGYLRELRHTKISVSPFGWGEVCFRDFETVIAGSMLIKPSMEHLRTTPSIFVPEETYVPVAWDFSDLAEKCECYLSDEPRRQHIVEAARRKYFESMKHGWVVPVVREMLRQCEAEDADLPGGVAVGASQG